MAARLGMPVGQVMYYTSYSDFLKWQKFFELEWNERSKDDYYHAQTAMEIVRMLSGSKKQWKVDDFLIEFKHSKKEKKETFTSLETSKMFWFGGVGLSMKKRSANV